jgi:hypothetical protein
MVIVASRGSGVGGAAKSSFPVDATTLPPSSGPS